MSSNGKLKMQNIASRRGVVGFTLIELMIVVAIIAFLVMVAMPSFQGQIRKTKRNIGKAELLSVVARQEQFFTNNKQYATALTDLGYSANPYAIDSDAVEVAVTAGGRIYTIQLASASATAYTLQAVPQLDQAKDTLCGTLQITSTGVKTETGSADVSNCW